MLKEVELNQRRQTIYLVHLCTANSRVTPLLSTMHRRLHAAAIIEGRVTPFLPTMHRRLYHYVAAIMEGSRHSLSIHNALQAVLFYNTPVHSEK